jgi:hypothetical protein
MDLTYVEYQMILFLELVTAKFKPRSFQMA